MADTWLIAALWMGLALVASLLAIRIKISAALVEIVLGTIAGNLIALRSNTWIDFIAGFGSIMLTFLAGAEIDPAVMRRQWRPAVAIGLVSFFFPFLAAMAFTRLFDHWSVDAAKIAGIAMSTTSVAVVYAVMVESGLAGNNFGQLILAACFVTDLGTVVALGLLFASYNVWLILFVIVTALAAMIAPRFLPSVFSNLGDRVSEPGARLLFVIIFGLSGLATLAKSEGVLPAYIMGFACAGFLLSHRDFARRLRMITMSMLAPFYFVKAGTFISLAQALAGIKTIAILFTIKVLAKIAGVWPTARAYHFGATDATYLTLMMATGLTFGTISSLYGLTHHLIDQAQYTALVTVVILTAIVPTLIAQKLFPPTEEVLEAESGGLGEIEIPPSQLPPRKDLH
ncbi:MAG: potassium transporter Kef [Candidatus Eremiobacter antarcticus]|nr:cation:proton antiporter [Candidatus Eremiobacteraeota bacterium]MBC5808733.1 cation:proton antiporter [Candidatus Eremiobacteraeota bacterium]PZR62251.1 MAG: potassium transporter Kef [Candidatus Eremiobacter sp. RRmetagenome_bin22]